MRFRIDEPFLVKLEAGEISILSDLINGLGENISACRAKLEVYKQIEALHFAGDDRLNTTMRMGYLTLKNGMAFESC